MSRVAILGCGKAKAAAAAPARELYTSHLFRMSLAHAERTCDAVYVASAQHGLLELAQVVAPYDLTLSSLTELERESWAERALVRFAGCPPRPTMVIYAGGVYADALTWGCQWWRLRHEKPLAGLKVGQRLAWLKRELAACASPSPP